MNIKALVVAAVAGIALLSACTSEPAQEASPTSSSTTTTTSTTPPSPVTSTVVVTETKQVKAPDATPKLHRNGYGDLMMGTPVETLKKSGRIVFDNGGAKDANGCYSGSLKGTDIRVDVSDDIGLSSIFFGANTKTPEGIGIGSTKAQVQATYPDLTKTANVHIAGIGPKGAYNFVLGDTLMNGGLVLKGQKCHN